MTIKKSRGKVFGATLVSSEKRALDMEVKRQLSEYDRNHELEIDAMVLWVLHEQFGFGKKRLKRFYNAFSHELNNLLTRYEMDTNDEVWLCNFKLKEYGIDIQKWANEPK